MSALTAPSERLASIDINIRPARLRWTADPDRSESTHHHRRWSSGAIRSSLANVLAIGLVLACQVVSAATDCGRLSPRECQVREARTLKANYLRNLHFVEQPPLGDGHAEGVDGSLAVARNLSGPPRISGRVKIDRLVGRYRHRLATSSDVMQHGRKVMVAGTVTVRGGRLAIYSAVDENFWQMAALFVERPVRGEAAPDELLLKGWRRIDVEPGKPTPFTANLIAIAGDHLLLLHAPDGEAAGIEIRLDQP